MYDWRDRSVFRDSLIEIFDQCICGFLTVTIQFLKEFFIGLGPSFFYYRVIFLPASSQFYIQFAFKFWFCSTKVVKFEEFLY